MTDFAFDNSYARDLEGLWLKAMPAHAPLPQLIRFNHALARELGVEAAGDNDDRLAARFCGNELPDGAQPLAMAYAGHQFGHFSPQLGDGRAILIGEVIDNSGKRRDIQLKGAGRTPFSRGGDGHSALGPVLREYLVSEFMHAAGVPTTRALAAVATGDTVFRETEKPAAVFTRVAASHIRIGTFQFFAARSDVASVKRLADHAIARHYPDVAAAPQPYLPFFEAVCAAQAKLIAQWTGFGFVHGVMNTDNMAVSGQTIDFGPCAFMDHYDPHALFSSIDQNGRYAFSNQPLIAQWNLARLAETLVPLMDEDQDKAVAALTAVLEGFPALFEAERLVVMRRKLGLNTAQDGDAELIKQLLDQMQLQSVDYTIAMRALAQVENTEGRSSFASLFADEQTVAAWLEEWTGRLAAEGSNPAVASQIINAVNPAFIPRNHRIEEAIRAAEDSGDFTAFHRLADVLAAPFDDQPEHADLQRPPSPEERVTKTFCGT
ncbi:MAG: YdiU family protein [Rhizobiaceae bacterium]